MMKYFILLGILFFWGFNTPSCVAEMSFESSRPTTEIAVSKEEMPPVERVRPPDEKVKKKHKKNQKHKKADSNTTKEFNVFTLLVILFLAIFLLGAFLFGFGIYTLPMLITGLVLMGISNITAIVLSLLMITGVEGVSGVAGAVLGIAAFIFVLISGVLDFVIGLVFLIWGALSLIPIAWIVGIILLALFLILLVFCILAVKNV